MSTLFISHASADAEASSELAAKLDQWGYGALFLDFDPERGIRAGADWEAELYGRLKMARALVAVVSRSFLDSRWCFAEVTQARALGKPIFPVKIEPCEPDSLLSDRQVVDLTVDKNAGYESLRRGLDDVLGGDLPFDSERPYPGLASFEVRDAGVFFGREEEQSRVIETLERMRRRGEPRLAVVLGASGCGKSSIVKAGVLPRLIRDRRRWLVVPPMRPGDHPEPALARAFAAAFEAAGAARGWRELAEHLADDTPAVHPWVAVAEDLREATGERQAAVVLTIDQFEELLGPATEEEGCRHVAFRARLRAALEAPDSPLLAVATLRSDFLGVFQLAPELRDLVFEDLPLGPMPARRMERVIIGPARRAGVEFEDELVRRLVEDTGSTDALPLLAFTLRELWERREGSHITTELYEARLGSIEGAVARIAEGIGKDAGAGEQRALRSAFLRMVRLDDEGRFVRRRAGWEEIPAEARPSVERFVDDHLLISDTVGGERQVEVAHEAMFRAWRRLAGWLDQERELLLFRQRLGNARAEWERLEQDDSALLDGATLTEAERWLTERREEFDGQERAFVDRSLERRRRLLAAAQRRRLLVVGGLAAGLAIATLLATLAGVQWRRAEQQRRLAVARQLATVAGSYGTETAEELVPRILLATESLRSQWTHEGYGAWASAAAGLMRGPAVRLKTEGRVTGLAVHPSEPWVAVADKGDGVRILEIAGGEIVIDLEWKGAAHTMTFSPDGGWLAVAKGETIAVWNTRGWTLAIEIDGFGHTDDIAFSTDGDLMVAAQREFLLGPVSTRTWRVPEPRPCDDDYCTAVAFSKDGRALAIGGVKGLEIWRRPESSVLWSDASRSEYELLPSLRNHVWKLRWVTDADVQVWTSNSASVFSARLGEFGSETTTRWESGERFGALSEDLAWTAIPESGDALALYGKLPGSRTAAYARLAIDENIAAADFSADRHWLLTGGSSLALWDLAEMVHFGTTFHVSGGAVRSVAFSPDGGSLALCQRGAPQVRILEDGFRREAAAFELDCSSVGFADPDRLVAREKGVYVLRREGSDWRNAGEIPELPPDAALSLSPDGRWAAVHRPYSANLRSRELMAPSRTGVVDLTTGAEVAWRTHEEDDIEAFLQEASNFHHGLTRDRLRVRWDPDPSGSRSEDSPELGEWGRLDVLDRVDGWTEVSFERSHESADGLWRMDDRSATRGNLLEPESERTIVTLGASDVTGAAFSPDLGQGSGSEWVALATRDGVALWRLGPVEALVEETCARVPRNLNANEWPLDGPPPATCPGR